MQRGRWQSRKVARKECEPTTPSRPTDLFEVREPTVTSTALVAPTPEGSVHASWLCVRAGEESTMQATPPTATEPVRPVCIKHIAAAEAGTQ